MKKKLSDHMPGYPRTVHLPYQPNATADDLLRLARTIRTGVHERFGIELVPEPNLVNCIL